LRSSLFTFATDLLDEGLETVADNVQHLGGADGITLASAYHDARDVFPHNPRRVVYFQEPGAVFFQPSPDRFGALELRPTVSALLDGRDLVADLVQVARRRDMDANAWVVLLHVDRGREIEPYAQRNAFGDPYLTQLCPANPDVRAYGRAVIGDIASRGVDSILMESFHHFPFAHGYHHERAFVEITPLTSFLLSLCFCESCAAAAAERGVDTTSLRAAVQSTVRDGLSSDHIDPVPIDDAAAVHAMFDGELGAFLDARSAVVTSLVTELVDAAREANPETAVVPVDEGGAIKGYTAGQPSGEPAPSIAWRLGVDLRQISDLTGALEVMAYASTAERVMVDLEAYAAAVSVSTKLGVILRPLPPDCDSSANLRSKVDVATALGVDRLDFYHYGLAPLAALDWVKSALTEGAAANEPIRRSEIR
jgi:hypothetical protein